MIWKYGCKVCGKVLDDEKAVMMHYLMEHRDVGHYAVPMALGELPVPMKREQPAQEEERPKLGRPAKQKEPEPPEEDEEEEDLSFD